MKTSSAGVRRPSAEQLAGFQPSGVLPVDRLRELAQAGRLEHVARGGDPLAAHAQGGELLFLLSGEALLMFVGGGTLVVVGAMGEGRYPLNRRATPITRAKAISDIEVLCIDERPLDVALTLQALVSGQAPGRADPGTATDDSVLRLAQRDPDELLREPSLRRLSRAQGRERVARGAVWLDVRTPSEYRNDRIAGAVNLPLDALRGGLDALDRGKEYVVYCQSGRRSSAAALLLARRGFDVWLLDAGLPGGKEC